MNLGDLNKVWEIRSLKRKPKEEEARKILERVAEQVQPIMRKRNWRVKLLSEFCPKNAALLGVNVGKGINIKLRLRRPNRDEEFFPFHEILDTMLHELCHNAYGPHNASFYKLWDDLRKECEDLINKGISGTGEGFDLPGRRLGGFSMKRPLSSLRQAASAAAQKRARLNSLLPSGPKRIGGDSSIMVALTPIQAAAMAAERRLRDNIWCGSESYEASAEDENIDPFPEPLGGGLSSGKSNLTSQKRCRESDSVPSAQQSVDPASSFIDLTKVVSETHLMFNSDEKSREKCNQMKDKLHAQTSDSNPKSNCVDLSGEASTSESIYSRETMHNEEGYQMWECSLCTLLNPALAPICELCRTQKPKDDREKHVWSCKFCTLENSVKLEKCEACGEWRYSYGAPVATQAPNRGT